MHSLGLEWAPTHYYLLSLAFIPLSFSEAPLLSLLGRNEATQKIYDVGFDAEAA